MKIKSLLHKSVELSIIDESQCSKILALNASGSRSWLERLFDVALIIMPLSALGILWHLNGNDILGGAITALTFLAAAILVSKLLNARFISLHIVCATSCGLLVLSGTMAYLPAFVGETDIDVPLFSTGVVAALWVSMLRNGHTLIKVSFMIGLVVSTASWIDAANDIKAIVSYLIVSSVVFALSLLPQKNFLNVAAQIVGSTFFMFSLLVFTVVEVNSDLISICVWGATIALGVAIRSKHLTSVDYLPEALIVVGALCMTGIIINAAIDRIGFGIPVVALLLFISIFIVVFVKSRDT